MAKKYLSLEGLAEYDSLFKGEFNSAISNQNVDPAAHNDIRVLISDLNTNISNFLDKIWIRSFTSSGIFPSTAIVPL